MGRDIHERRRLNDEKDPNPSAKYRKTKTSSVDWQSYKGSGALIGAFYRQRFSERLYERTYLDG